MRELESRISARNRGCHPGYSRYTPVSSFHSTRLAAVVVFDAALAIEDQGRAIGHRS